MHRSVPVLAVAALLVLAGCSAFGGPGTTREPLDVSETTEPTSPPQDTPPVIAFDPVEDTAPDPFDLVEAHQQLLEGRPYTVTYEHRETYANGTTLSSENWTTAFGANRSVYYQERRSVRLGDHRHEQLYANGTHVYQRLSGETYENAIVRRYKSQAGAPVQPREAIVTAAPQVVRSALLTMNVTDVQKLETVPSGVDEPVFRVVANETRGEDPYGEKTTNATLSLLVTEDGRIIELNHEYTFRYDGETIHAETRVQYVNVDTTTVDPPDWVPANATDGDEEDSIVAALPDFDPSTGSQNAGTEAPLFVIAQQAEMQVLSSIGGVRARVTND